MATCSSSKKAFKQAQEFEAAGLYVQAAEYDLRALKEKPNFTEALVHLRQVAPKAYAELLSRAEHASSAENWDVTVSEYERMENLIRRFQRYGVVLETINIAARLDDAKGHAANRHFTNAEDRFARGEWAEAAYEYLQANDYIRNYNQCVEKAIESFLKLGDQRITEEEFSEAIDVYVRILDFRPNHDVSKERIADAYYLLGQQHFESGSFREALAHFEAIDNYVENYKDADEWRERAYENAVQHACVYPFFNRSQQTVDGYQIAATIANRLPAAELKFAEFLSYPEMLALLNQGRSAVSRMSETELLAISQEGELDSFVWGRIRDVDIKEDRESFVEHEHVNTIVEVDSAGNEIETSETIYYREYRKARQIRIRVETFIAETERGRQLENERYDKTSHDEVVWIAYQGSIYDLPEGKRGLLDASRNLQAPQIRIDRMLDEICTEISDDILAFYR